MVKPLELSDLNPKIIRSEEARVAMLLVCNVLNEMYSSSSTHTYLLGDCVLAKLNMLKKGKRVRINVRRVQRDRPLLKRKQQNIVVPMRKNNYDVQRQVDLFFDLSATGQGLDDHRLRVPMYREHARKISRLSQEHKKAVHKAIVNEMTKEGCFTDNEKKSIKKIYGITKE